MTFTLPVITCPAGVISRILTISGVGSIGIYIHIGYNLIKLNKVDLISFFYIEQMIGVSVLLK